jgi:catechol 2,3-dioxygenase-like lactoylglutathione lyase family enzyme
VKRFHVHVSVEDLAQSVRFYSTLFSAEPTVLKDDYAKWMLEDPRVNFAISTGSGAAGISHLGIQAEDEGELAEVYERLSHAERPVIEENDTTCCYARSDKQWIADPQGVPWETFFTYGEATVYGQSGALTKLGEASGGLSTCGCAPPALTRAAPAAEACCEPSCCAA